jgi:signal transduction histidine kinase
MSIKYKIALLFASLVAFLLILVSVSVYFFSVEERHDTFRRRLKSRAGTTVAVYSANKQYAEQFLQRMDAAGVASLYNKSITIIEDDNSHRYLYSDKKGDSLYLSDEVIAQTKASKEYFFSYGSKQAVALYVEDESGNFIVAVSAEDAIGEEYLQGLRKILTIAAIVSIALSFVAGFFFARRLIRPMARITQEVNLITSNNLSQRIDTGTTRDELNKLAETFNNLLDRLQESFAIQRRFISNASHELSTPLTSISSQLEVALQKDRGPDEYRHVISSVYDDVLELQQLTKSLLDIAKAGTQGSIELTEVRIDEVLFKVIKDIEKHNPEYKVHLEFGEFPEEEEALTVFGNADLLFIAIKNIVENGCKYSDNQQAKIIVSFKKEVVELNVFNKGDVIAEADIQNIFQPFFRSESARTKPGFGLGLTLSRRIVALHRGKLSVSSDPLSGTCFTLSLPCFSAI